MGEFDKYKDEIESSISNMDWRESVKLSVNKRHIAEIKKSLLELSPKVIDDMGQFESFNLITKFYSELIFFPDNEIISKFHELGYNNYFLRWFCPIRQIIAEFNKIESSGLVKIDRLVSFHTIKIYLTCQVASEYMEWSGLVPEKEDKENSNRIRDELRNVIRQRNYETKKPRKYRTEFQSFFHDILTILEKFLGSKAEAEKAIRNGLAGKTEWIFLRQLLDDYFKKEKNLTKRKYHNLVYDLIKLLAKNSEMLSENEYYQEDNNDTYDSYETYRERRIGDIVYRE
ncbi:MAG: hypothetical protein H6549_13375 [Chitinophagales bacterium]|nr:hypothetical protein [Chitinophagales bacterium]